MDWTDFQPQHEAIKQRFLEEPIDVPENEKYPGTTMQCLAELLEGIEDLKLL